MKLVFKYSKEEAPFFHSKLISMESPCKQKEQGPIQGTVVGFRKSTSKNLQFFGSSTFQNPIHSIFPTLLNIENTTSCNIACNVPGMTMLSRRHICLVVVVVVCYLIQISLRAMASDNSVHSAAVNEVHLVPIDIIIRPIPPVLEETKVNSLIKTIQVGSICRAFKQNNDNHNMLPRMKPKIR